MITLDLTPNDLARTRFGYSQLGELFASFNVLRDRSLHHEYQAWVDETLPNLFGVEFPYMRAIISPYGYPLDFVTLTPANQHRAFEDEIEELRTVPADAIRKDIQAVIAWGVETEAHRHFLAYPHEALECLINELHFYWNHSLADYWLRIRSALEHDILYRARQIALHGTESMFGNLASKVRYQAGKLEILSGQVVLNGQTEHSPDGKGVQFVPTIFKLPCMVSWQLDHAMQSLVVYSARGNSLWHIDRLPDPEKELVHVLGDARAALLLTLQEPAHTTQLAAKLFMTAGAISQHLSRLRQAGIVDTYRSGHRVYYYLTLRGQKLLELFTN